MSAWVEAGLGAEGRQLCVCLCTNGDYWSFVFVDFLHSITHSGNSV